MSSRVTSPEPTGQSTRRGLRLALLAGAVVGGLYLLWDLAKIILAAALIAYVLDPPVRRMQAQTSRTMATLLVVGTALVVAVGGSMLLWPVLQNQIDIIQAGIRPEEVVRAVEQIDRRLTELLPLLGGEVDLSGQVQGVIDRFRDRVIQGSGLLLNATTTLLLIPFVAAFLLHDGPQLRRGLIRFVPNRYFEFTLEALHKVDQQLQNYFRGLLLDILIITILSGITLWVLGVESFVLLGLIAGITTIIPYAGSLLGGGIAALVHLAQTGQASVAALLVVAFAVIQALDEAIIQPIVFSQTVNLHPLEVLLVVWVGAQFFGAVGMVLAIPVAGTGKVVLTEGVPLIQRYGLRDARSEPG